MHLSDSSKATTIFICKFLENYKKEEQITKHYMHLLNFLQGKV